MATATELEFNNELETETLTDKAETKELPCRICGRRCVVTRFAAPHKTECTTCRTKPKTRVGRNKPEPVVFEFNDDLETEVLTDKEETKEVPCAECQRRCVVTTFATPGKVKCNTCRGEHRREHREAVQINKARTLGNPATLANLADAIVARPLAAVPLCPFDPEHDVELKGVTHSPTYGPRHLLGYDKNGLPRYEQDVGEVITYQCNDCHVVISFSTQHPMVLMRQNEARRVEHGPDSISIHEATLGVRKVAV